MGNSLLMESLKQQLLKFCHNCIKNNTTSQHMTSGLCTSETKQLMHLTYEDIYRDDTGVSSLKAHVLSIFVWLLVTNLFWLLFYFLLLTFLAVLEVVVVVAMEMWMPFWQNQTKWGFISLKHQLVKTIAAYDSFIKFFLSSLVNRTGIC